MFLVVSVCEDEVVQAAVPLAARFLSVFELNFLELGALAKLADLAVCDRRCERVGCSAYVQWRWGELWRWPRCVCVVFVWFGYVIVVSKRLPVANAAWPTPTQGMFVV